MSNERRVAVNVVKLSSTSENTSAPKVSFRPVRILGGLQTRVNGENLSTTSNGVSKPFTSKSLTGSLSIPSAPTWRERTQAMTFRCRGSAYCWPPLFKHEFAPQKKFGGLLVNLQAGAGGASAGQGRESSGNARTSYRCSIVEIHSTGSSTVIAGLHCFRSTNPLRKKLWRSLGESSGGSGRCRRWPRP